MLSFIPNIILPALTDLTPEMLTARGVRWLLLDFDNTIVPYTTDEPTDKMLAWLHEMQASPIKLCIVSNSKRPRVVRFAEKYGLDCITHAKKPFSRGIKAAQARFGFEPREAALAGDQIYTDVLGANCAGLTSVLVSAICNHNLPLKLRHIAELPFIAIGKRRIQHEQSGKIS
ncbi:MAG: YqeG family HAD IIIA-type phosphatase [Clostridiales bacterium]|nr:YqeG family HAD IIIA-type phosphatase [Clostridiales bacterium]